MAPYIETHQVIELANAIFGGTKYSTAVLSHGVDFSTCDGSSKWSIGCYAIVRVSLTDFFTIHEDVGYGEAANHPTMEGALEVALKSAVSDAFKRACRLFGRALGNSIYDSQYRLALKNGLHRGAVAPIIRPQDDPSDQSTSTVDPAIFADSSDQATQGSLIARINQRH